MHPIPRLPKSLNASGIHCQGAVHPAGQGSGIALLKGVTTGKHCDTALRSHREIQDLVSQHAAAMDRHQQGLSRDLGIYDAAFDGIDTPLEPGPMSFQGSQHPRPARGRVGVDAGGGRRRVVQNQQDCREQPVAGRKLDNGSTAHPSADTPSHFPRLEEFLARQTLGLAYRPGNSRKESLADKSVDGVPIEHAAR